MDCRSGKIYELQSEDAMQAFQKQFHEQNERELVRIEKSESQTFKEMNPAKRKGRMRNKPCPCGSEIKFKRCCWSAYA